MDITVSENKTFTNKLFNGETVNWGICYTSCLFLFLILKQLLRFILPISASISVLVSFIICMAVLFVFEKKYVFTKAHNKSTPKQLIYYVFRCLVDVGFYKIGQFVFVKTLGLKVAFLFLCIIIIYLFFNYYFDRLIVFDARNNAKKKKNGRAYKLFFDNRFVLASMLLGALSFGFVAIISQLFPFGDTTVLRMDLYHQYGPLFVELYDRVTGVRSFLYSWTTGGGSGFLGNYFNYLSSPLSFIILLFDRKEMPFAITSMVAIKCLLSSASFTFYLKKSQKSHSYVTAVFGNFYGFCAYFLAYYWNIMWIDGMILFPLILLGIEKIINEKKAFLYIASLTVLFHSTYYIAYMTCIFSVIYFICYYSLVSEGAQRLEPQKQDIKSQFKELAQNKFINRGFIFAGASLLAAGLCAVTLIPVYMILQGSSATSDSFPSSFEGYFDIISFLTSHLSGLETTIRSSGDDVLPNIYSGILTIVLIPLYVVNKKIRIKEKAVYLVILAILFASFNTNYANFVWHAFHFPNDLPYRFSFMYSFILIFMAFRCLKNIRGFDYKDICYSGILWIAFIIIMQKYQTNKMHEYTIYLSIVLVALWCAVLLLIKKNLLKKGLIGLTVFAIAFCEMIIGNTVSFSFTQQFKNYTEHYNTYCEAFDYLDKTDKSFYREELSYLDTRMDPCLYDYRGMSVFSSMAYEDYSQNQYSLGMFGNRINSYTYNTQTPVYNMMYGIKYIANTEGDVSPGGDYYTLIHTTKDKKVDIYQNDYYLPVAFETSYDVDDWDNSEGNPFEVQQSFITTSTGVSDLFIPATFIKTETTLIDCEEVEGNGTYFITKSDPDSESGSVEITIEAVNDSNLYVYISSPDIKNVNYYWGDGDNSDSKFQDIEEPYIMDLGKHKAGEQVRISLSCDEMENETSNFDIYAYNIDKSAFESAYDLLKEGQMKIDKYSDTSLEGTVNAGYEGYLYTSIPYDKGWSIYIDGKKQKAVKIADSQLACKIKQGEHSVKLKYTPNGLLYGLLITLASYAGVAVYLLLRKKLKKKKKGNEVVENV